MPSQFHFFYQAVDVLFGRHAVGVAVDDRPEEGQGRGRRNHRCWLRRRIEKSPRSRAGAFKSCIADQGRRNTATQQLFESG